MRSSFRIRLTNKHRMFTIPKLHALREDEEYDYLQVKHVVDWILANRGPTSFAEYDEELLTFAVVMGSEQGLFYIASEGQTIHGVCLLQKIEPFKVHVQEMLCKQPGLLKRFLTKIEELWPTIKYLTAYRDGKPIEYKISTLKRLL